MRSPQTSWWGLRAGLVSSQQEPLYQFPAWSSLTPSWVVGMWDTWLQLCKGRCLVSPLHLHWWGWEWDHRFLILCHLVRVLSKSFVWLGFLFLGCLARERRLLLGLFISIPIGVSRPLTYSFPSLRYRRLKRRPPKLTIMLFLRSWGSYLVCLLSIFQNLLFVLPIMSRF